MKNLYIKTLSGCLSLFMTITLSIPVFAQPARLIIIDPLVANENLPVMSQFKDDKVVTLPSEGNPITLIASELDKAKFDELHLFILTKPGSIIFDELNIIPGNIEEFAKEIRDWKPKLRPGSVIIIHSAVLTSDPGGLFLVEKIKEYTDCTVTVR